MSRGNECVPSSVEDDFEEYRDGEFINFVGEHE